MDPTEILNVRFHMGGEFIRLGQTMDYVGGDEEISEIERDKLSLQEVIGHLKDHMNFKHSMKLYFLIPGKRLDDGLMFLSTDSACMQMAEYCDVGGVADIYVEYHGEEDSEHSSIGSDFEDEIVDIDRSDDESNQVISAEPADSEEDDVVISQVLVTDKKGAISHIINSPVKATGGSRTILIDPDVVATSQKSWS
uniref:Uncharacterized protein n=1 Tax=Avena sativa TaxID=4498 RepID=A0ACD5W613_AVESA